MSEIMKEDKDCFTILSIDPGTIYTGYGLIKAKIEDFTMVQAKAWTVNASELIESQSWDEQLYGERFARVNQHAVKFKRSRRCVGVRALCVAVVVKLDTVTIRCQHVIDVHRLTSDEGVAYEGQQVGLNLADL